MLGLFLHSFHPIWDNEVTARGLYGYYSRAVTKTSQEWSDNLLPYISLVELLEFFGEGDSILRFPSPHLKQSA
jgi:hypothetical protein